MPKVHEDKPQYRYRLLAGRHIENNAEGKEVCYSAGDVFDSTSRLETLNGPPGMSQKFEFLGEAPGSSTPPRPIAQAMQDRLPGQAVPRTLHPAEYDLDSEEGRKFLERIRGMSPEQLQRLQQMPQDFSRQGQQSQPDKGGQSDKGSQQQKGSGEKSGQSSQKGPPEDKEEESEPKPPSPALKAHLPVTGPKTPPQNIKEYHQLLDKMSVEELRQHAAEEEIDLGNAKSRAEIVKVLKQHTPA